MKLKWREVTSPWGAPALGFALNLGEIKVIRIFVCHNAPRGSLMEAPPWLLNINGEYTRHATEQEACAVAEAWFDKFVEAVTRYAQG